MKMQSVYDVGFVTYGAVLESLDCAGFVEALRRETELPLDSVVYVPSEPALESQAVFEKLRDGVFGGMPIQIGYCNGSNMKLNCLEYHRGSEVIISADDIVLLLAGLQKIDNGWLDTCEVEAFLVPAGKAVLLYETSLHYAPCNGPGKQGFRTAIVLPLGTNTARPDVADPLLRAKNKWLLAHPEAPEAADGAYVGLRGENITLA